MMIYPMNVERDEDGCWTHPAWDAFCDGREYVPHEEVLSWLAENRIDWSLVNMLDDVPDDHPAYLAYEEGEASLGAWELAPPGEGWFLLSIHDHEDGPIQLWARHKTPLDAIAAERLRQVEAEGWSPEHDDEHAAGEMATAAGCYALSAGWPFDRAGAFGPRDIPTWWPWDDRWWKPAGHRRNLIKAAALIVAELERLDRVEREDSDHADD